MSKLSQFVRSTLAVAPIASRRTALSLVEVLVVMAILAVLTAILLPSLLSVRRAAKTVVCSTNMKTVAMNFQFFAQGQHPAGRGDSHQLPGNRFWIDDFQESQYGLDEFWNAGESNIALLNSADEPMLCPLGPTPLQKRRGFPCGQEAVSPAKGVSVGLNMRLYRAVLAVKGKKLLASPLATKVNSRVLDRSHTPLLWDVDGQEAVNRGVSPFYSAPAVAPDDPYTSGKYWFPSRRHSGKTSVGFVGGHVLSSEASERERWDWAYQAETGQ